MFIKYGFRIQKLEEANLITSLQEFQTNKYITVRLQESSRRERIRTSEPLVAGRSIWNLSNNQVCIRQRAAHPNASLSSRTKRLNIKITYLTKTQWIEIYHYLSLRRQGSNLRPQGYDPCELTNCSTPRCKTSYCFHKSQRKWLKKVCLCTTNNH